MYTRKFLLTSILLSLAVFTFVQPADNTAISGYLKDVSGSPIPGAYVKLRRTGTGVFLSMLNANTKTFRWTTGSPVKNTYHQSRILTSFLYKEI